MIFKIIFDLNTRIFEFFFNKIQQTHCSKLLLERHQIKINLFVKRQLLNDVVFLVINRCV